MAVLSTQNLVFALGVLTLYILTRFLRPKKHDLPLPPGPKGVPLLGNIYDLPRPDILECHHWLKHKDLYGPISSITVLGQTFVIVSDTDIALELLSSRAAIYSGRPKMVFSGDMVGWTNTLAMHQPDATFKQHRRNIAKVAGASTCLTVFDHIQNEEAVHFLLNVLDTPDNLFEHIRKEAGAVILRITYGYTPNAQGRDPLVDMAGQAMADFTEASAPGRWAVDVLPFLRYLPDGCPGTSFKRTARDMAKQLVRTAEEPYAFVKKQMREKTAKTSFLSQALESIGVDDAETERIHKWSAASMYTGGADTTVSALMTFFLAMAVFPEVQKKAQEELDRVIGGERLPVTSDKASLPYIEAVVKETHRWHPIAPMALPHCCTEEDSINGYRIPKGAMVLPNNWWFTHDPAVYPDPMTFRPERYITTPSHTAEPDPRTWTFGYGRRVCPGRYVADNALYTTIAQSLAVFNVEKPVENGKTVEPKVAFEPGLVSHPVPYRVSIKPRSRECEMLVRQAEEMFPWGESDAPELEGLR
ncbi:hypothetical protein P3342_004979 [Pyrenophora teres f. teres]|uniref:CypX Cytochrome P450 n=2 Tax=Pyrenophora teres f. teres TaxID=97479 RepID=E3S384_PYRTT|nr:hypothetical protein PTT_16896 [Pyrenophora teres f. teres 0-1]KAE8846421.1 hypothetical protein HRS9139_00988 [Pyrenophora teres f. teres]KAE8848561.1 hypothetical protein PTNB85_02404 [Pyrenophora teres f. teres]KAE8853272.1 hypothetical protein HRS9122_00264 [Pyrenophora teres f. teres]KAE8868486.1 hypothetical protein PTNB29_02397 [Pyrenophora teres f. teres]